MRMWNVDPRVMCRKHLLGEHVEMHMFIGTIRQGKSLQGYIDKGLVEVRNILHRHNKLAAEMKRRGMRHNSDIAYFSMPAKYFVRSGQVDVNANLIELARRCDNCAARQVEMSHVSKEYALR